MHYLGVDTGGTFTDFFHYQGGKCSSHKVLSTPEAPEQAILLGIHELKLDAAMAAGDLTIVHGSTVATNAALENKGVKTVYVTNKGLEDVLTIARQTRAELYNLTPTHQPIPVPRTLCLGVNTRRGANGELITPLSDNDIQALKGQIKALDVDAIAINLLFSFLADNEERRLADALTELAFVSHSAEVLPEYKEYERGIATWLNASLGPLVASYLHRLQSAAHPSTIAMMQSTGGISNLENAARQAVRLLLSGPAGGLAGARYIADQANIQRLLTFDMGGTSTDVAMIDGNIKLTSEGSIGPYPVAVPMVDMHTIGAGGGSIAVIDDGGLLAVGPKSAGAMPGPACYGRRSETQYATVTDANAVLGRIHPDYFLGGNMQLDLAAARAVIEPIAQQLNCSIETAADGIIALANDHMTRALRVISIEQGYDPKGFRLCSFGGAGGLHVCALADQLSIKQAIVPINGGVLSAFGMLVAAKEKHLSVALPKGLLETTQSELQTAFDKLHVRGIKELKAEGAERSEISITGSIDLRYLGQSHTLNLPFHYHSSTQSSTQDNTNAPIDHDLIELADHFHQAHKRRFGHHINAPIEIVNVRLKLSATATFEGSDFDLSPWPISKPSPAIGESTVFASGDSINKNQMTEYKALVYERKTLATGQTLIGPALIVETVATTWVPPDWHVTVDKVGNLLLDKR